MFQEFSTQFVQAQAARNHFNLNFLFQEDFLLYAIYYLSILLLNFIAYSYLFLKFFRVMCYSKMTFEWFPLINPYRWPFAWFDIITESYFDFWLRIFPNLKFATSSFGISEIIALEALNSVLYFCVRVAQALVLLLERLEKTIYLHSLT